MTLSTSRQQFLAYETHAPEDIGYGRRGGVFLSSCVCAGLVILSLVLAALVGVIVYYVTYFKLSQKPTNFWDDTERFGNSGPPSPDLRLPPSIVPSFYRLKLFTDLEKSSFSGDVYITIRASKKAKEIILHAKDLSINKNAKLTEQIYEKVDTLHARRRRDTPDQPQSVNNTISNGQGNGSLNTQANTHLNTPNTPNTNVESSKTIENSPPLNETQNNPPPSNITQPILDATKPDAPNTGITNTNGSATEIRRNTNDESKIDSIQPTAVSVQSTEVNPINKTQPIRTVAPSTQVTHSSVRNIKIISVQESTGDRLILTLASALKPDVDYTLELSFEGNISNSMIGFYKSTYVNNQLEERQLGVTQFEPTHARAAFPCFDEPSFKAKFEISIAHRKNISVLSNMKVASQEPIPEKPEWQWTHFERSVKMSTYLVAYVISDFQSSETTYLSQDNITKAIRIWTRPELIHKAKYALSITPKLLEYYEHVFGVPYALDKVDLVAIPDFSSGAMENWGLITFRETTLLVDESESVPRDRQAVAIDVAHELAHQWFGNLVTMRWWTDLWLNEGFATYIEYVGVDHIEPEWNMFESFTRDKMDLLRADSLKNTSPVSLQVKDASEISQKFDEISYTKGANLIRMLNHTISEELFHKGLVNYLNQWKYANAEENDLWQAMTSAVESDPVLKGRSLVAFMNSWTRQPGFPVVTVQRDYRTGGVVFEQHLFTTSNDPYKEMADQLWHIPISWTAMDAPLTEWSTKPRLWLTERSTRDTLPVNSSQPLYINVGAIGYYRVNYDSKNWELLSKTLKSGHVKSPITKAQLIDDAFNLAKTGQLNYSLALSLTTCVIDGEDSKIVWDLLLSNMAFLKYALKVTPGYVYFQDFVKILLKKQLERLNYGLTKPKDDNEALLIENLVSWECSMGSDRCLQWAREQFNSWSSQADWSVNPIPSYLRSLVYNVALKYGGRREFDFLWKVFMNSTDPNVKTIIISNLPATREESLIAMLLEKSLTEIPKQYAVSAWAVDAPLGPAIAQAFLINNFDRVYNKFTEIDSFTFLSVLNGAFGFVNTQEELDRLKSFAVEHKEKLRPMSQTLQKLVDTATMRIDWVHKHAAHIANWFREFVVGPSGAATNNSSKNTSSQPTLSQNDVRRTAESNTSNVMVADAPNPNPQEDPNAKPAIQGDPKPGIANDPNAQNSAPAVVKSDPSLTNSAPAVAQSDPNAAPVPVNNDPNAPAPVSNSSNPTNAAPTVQQNDPNAAPSLSQNDPVNSAPSLSQSDPNAGPPSQNDPNAAPTPSQSDPNSPNTANAPATG